MSFIYMYRQLQKNNNPENKWDVTWLPKLSAQGWNQFFLRVFIVWMFQLVLILTFFFLSLQAQNRFKVPLGTKFYRVKAVAWNRKV